VAYLAQCPTTTLASDESSLIHFLVREGERSRPFICPPSAIVPPNKSFRGLSPKKDSTKLLPLDNIAMTPDQNPSTALSLQKMDNHACHITGSRDCSKRHKQNLQVKKSDPFASKTLQKHMHTYIHGSSQIQRIGVRDKQTRPPRQDK
jgi:hypothetical protein